MVKRSSSDIFFDTNLHTNNLLGNEHCEAVAGKKTECSCGMDEEAPANGAAIIETSKSSTGLGP